MRGENDCLSFVFYTAINGTLNAVLPLSYSLNPEAPFNAI
jgi:hypothetical protein